jgi:translation initiation factor IF-2
MAEAAERAAKENAEESRILRRIILPPRKKPRKRRKVPARFKVAKAARPVVHKRPEKVELQSPVSIKDFSQTTGIKTGAIIKKLMEAGVMANVNQILDDETVESLGVEFGIEVTLQKAWRPEDEFEKIEAAAADPEKLQPRPPVVALLGHVDHGKTSLLDRIRHSDVTSGEFGGITQHMGAYQVTTDSGHRVSFLDTPGHEAFTEMRARGADITDIVILVVAADDGVMPQTIEAINHANAAKVPIVVAINKIDRPEAEADRVKRQLTNHGLVPEEWGGDVIMVPVSAITGQGVDQLIEMLALQAEMMELKADPDSSALGAVVEARRTEGQGVVATILVQSGTLRAGDIIVAGASHGRIRSITDDHGRSLEEAGPSLPAEISGLGGVPEAGDRFYVVEDLQTARDIAATRAREKRLESQTVRQRVSMENLLESIQAAGSQELKLVLKADVQGTLEVLKRTLADMSIPEVTVSVIHSAVGSVNDSDVLLADASDAIIIGFNVLVDGSARVEAERAGVDVRNYNIIYRLIDDMKAALENKLAPEIREVVRGHAEVRDLFRISRLGTIAGCRVVDGVIPRRATIRVAREGAVIYEGRMDSLKHFKDDVREVREGFECGIKIAGYDDIKVGDVFEAYETEEVKRKLS